MINNIHVKGKDSDMYNFLKHFSYAMVIIGAINWAFIGLFGIDLVATLFGGQLSIASRVIYTLVGVAGLWSISILFKRLVPMND